MITRRQNGSDAGSALIATFWLIAVMGMVVFTAVRFVAIDTQFVTAQRGISEADGLAERGLALAAHPKALNGDSLLSGTTEDGMGRYEAVVTTEESRLNPNTLIASNNQSVLTRLFTLQGLAPDMAMTLAGAMTDWVDADSSLSLHGAESAAYAARGRIGLPLNRPFESLDEIRLVFGMDQLEIAHPNWRESFTVWTSGQVDVTAASPEILAAITGVTLETARHFVATIAGRDGIRFSADDLRFDQLEPALRQLGGQSSPLLALGGPTRRIESIGQFGRYRSRLVLVVRDNSTLMRDELPIPALLVQ